MTVNFFSVFKEKTEKASDGIRMTFFNTSTIESIFAALWLMDLSYEIISDGYDPDYNAMHTILQLEVV